MSDYGDDDISRMKNFGPKTAQWLHEAGIHTGRQLAEMGAVAAYQHLKATQPGVSIVTLYAMQGAILGLHWNNLPPDMKAELQAAVGYKP